MDLRAFHPAVAEWFATALGAPTEPQRLAWPAIARGRHTLIAAPTGSGKTLAAFLAAIDSLVREGLERGGLPDRTEVVYVSPLKALSNDVRRNLEEPLRGIRETLAKRGLPAVEVRSLVRTGDTGAARRAAMVRRPPHILVTTPESLYILLTSAGGRRMLGTVRSVIVDEIHAVIDDKRGAHLALTLERLDALTRGTAGRLPTRIGLSATQRPVHEVARFLVGTRAIDRRGRADCEIVDVGHRRDLDLGIELPGSPLESVMSAEVWVEVYSRLAELVAEHRTTLVFVNTRRMAERAARHLGERVGAGAVTAHHGSLARDHRLEAEQRLKSGALRCLVATASLELGIDVGDVDLVCCIGSVRSIGTLLQRVGRSGHTVRGRPKGRVLPTSRDELVEAAAALDAVRRGELEVLELPRSPLDVLAQQIVAEVAVGERGVEEMFDLVRGAYPYGGLSRGSFDAVVRMLASGFTTRRGRRGALLHHDTVNGRLRGRRGAGLTALTSGGAIPDSADYRVVLEPSGAFLGTVDEDFAVESLAGNIFQLGNSSWRIRKIEQGRVLVEDARGEPPNIPFWFGEAPSRSAELSAAVSRLREEVACRLANSRRAAREWLSAEVGTGDAAAGQIVDYLAAGRAALGELPTRERIILERFFDEAGDQHVVIHAPFGSRINRAWGLALRKRFCRRFNFELQAAATDDALVLSLGPTHSFPAEEVFSYLASGTVRELLVQALLDAPMFGVRWRWNASRSLAIPRWSGGRRVPPRLQRMRAEDLVASVFPDQLACAENLAGDREIPDHPLVGQTIDDCLHEAMDVEGLERLLAGIESGSVTTLARELREPSPLAHEILNARPYAFLDDAPLEERRTRAVFARRWLDPQEAGELGRLDPSAIDEVRAEAWPEVRDADELHDALVLLGCLTAEDGRPWRPWLEELIAAGRATRLVTPRGKVLWTAAERLPELEAIHPSGTLDPPIAPARGQDRSVPAQPLLELVRSRLEGVGPVTAERLARSLDVPEAPVRDALLVLETQGVAMRGAFTGAEDVEEWCDRGLLARIHRRTIRRLRREIEPVSKQVFMRFLLDRQRLTPRHRVEGVDGLAAALGRLEGFEIPAVAWETDVLPSRLERYDPAWLDAVCLSGRFVWGRVPRTEAGGARRPVRTTPIVLLPRRHLGAWRRAPAPDGAGALSTDGRAVLEAMRDRGASFFDDLVRDTGLLRSRVEVALAELVAAGLCASDSFTGLRALLTPADRRAPLDRRRRRPPAPFGMENAGRWSLLGKPGVGEELERREPGRAEEPVARALLERYGVVFRGLLERESLLPPWRSLLYVYRRLEARGEVRGGRFVDGLGGEQFALPEAVAALRATRRSEPDGEVVSISAADPLNLVGIVVPGPRVPALARNRVLLRDGLPVAVLESGRPRLLVEADPAERWQLRNALVQRRVPPQIRAYLGRSA